MSCSGCGKNSPIQNKKYHLCGECVFRKGHDGKSKQEVYSERSKEREVKRNNDFEELQKAVLEPSIMIQGKLPQKGDRLFVQGGYGPISPVIYAGNGKYVIDEEAQKNIDNQNAAEEREKEDLRIQPETGGTWIGYYPKNANKPKKQKPIKKQSSEQAEINRLYKLACADMDHVTEPVCTGCLQYQGGDIKLSHSHIISQKDCKNIGRPELIYDIENIHYHCLDFGENVGCHRKWESPVERKTLADYEKNMRYIKSISEELYNRYTSK